MRLFEELVDLQIFRGSSPCPGVDPFCSSQLIYRTTDKLTIMSGAFIRDESGTAYGLGIIAIFLVVCTAISIIVSPVINGMVDEYNGQVDDGYVSEQRGDAMNFLLVVWKGLPIWSVFALLAWGVVRALEQKSSGVG